MRKFNFLSLLAILFVVAFSSCKKTDPAPGPEEKLANKEWKSEGVYVSGTKTINPNIRIEFVKSVPLNTIKVNGTTLTGGATWTLSSDGTTLNITYLDPVAVLSSTFTPKTQTLTVSNLTDTDLTLKGPATEDIQLLGIITLTPTSEIRFNTSGTAATPVTDANLIRTGGWKSETGNANTGLFVNNVKQSDSPITMRFTSVFGINLVTIGGVPAPATWTLNDTKTTLTIVYPKNGATNANTVTFNISRLTATELWLGSTNSATIMGIVTFSANSELRMVAQ